MTHIGEDLRVGARGGASFCVAGIQQPRAGGTDATSTPADAGCVSRHFCTTKPPTECPITAGRVGRPLATESTSST